MKFVTRVVKLMLSREWWLCVWLCVEIALVVALIWSVGPLLAIGATRPLESATVRAWLIALVLLAGCMRLVWRLRGSASEAGVGMFARWREHRTNASYPKAADSNRASTSTDDSAPVAELRARFRDALYLLRHANPTTGKLAAWLDAATGQYAYRLPWYLVVGSSGSGKTAVLIHGGLELSTAEQAARAAAGRVEATQQCDWWFSNHAVLVDTPGHYVEAADDTQRRGTEWRALLALLRKHRPRQPLNGVLLTVAVDTLLALNEAERTAYATRLRKPLQSMRAALDMQVPIYLCFTRMDRLSGFVEYFSALNREGREQVWGATFPLDKTAAASKNSATTAFTDAFDKLAQRLADGLRDVVSADPDLDSRALAYLFPQQFASLRDVLDGFRSTLFQTSHLEANLVARGIYFTSALQSGPTVDRILTPVRQHLHSAMPSPATAISRVRQSYFLKQLLHAAVFADAGLAGTSRASLRRRLIAHTALAVTSVALLLTLLAGWTISYSNNRAYLDEVGAHVAVFNQHARQPTTLAVGALAPLAPMLNEVRSLPRSEYFEIDAPPPLRYGLGLYPGAKISEASETIYRRALDDKLLPQAAARLEALLSNAPPDDPEYTYDALKAYLMLHDTAHYDGGFVAAWLILDTQTSLPSNTTLDQRAHLEAHLTRLFEARAVASPFALNAALVSRVRERLARDSFAQRAYHQLRRELLRMPRAAPLTVVSAGGPQAALVFRRLSGKPLSDGIDSLYTYRGYWDVVDKRVAGATAQLRSEEPWVLGIDAAPAVDTARLVLEVRRAYFNDYIEVWDAYLNDLTLMDSKSIAQSTRIARTLSAPDSPLRQFLQAAARETNLSRTSASEQRPAADRMQQRLGKARQSLAAMFGNAAPAVPQTANEDRPEAVVDAHFEPLRRLVTSSDGGAAGTAPFDGNLHVVDELYGYLTSASAALNSGNSPPPTDVFDKLQADAGRMPMPLRKMFGDLSQNGSAQIGGALRANLAQDAQGGIGRLCRHMIAGRYPFVRNATRDVALDDFSKLFAPGGLMDSFFQKNLASQIDVSGSRWRFRRDATGAASGDARLVGSFQNADIIRTAFFSGNAMAPALQVELTPLELDPGIAQYTLDVDGQTIRYAHGPQLPTTVKWPGPVGGAGQVSLQISTPGGADGLQTQGPWALHRLLDKASITPGVTPEHFVATFDFNGRKLSLRVIANSSYNPFRLPQMDAFSCPS